MTKVASSFLAGEVITPLRAPASSASRAPAATARARRAVLAPGPWCVWRSRGRLGRPARAYQHAGEAGREASAAAGGDLHQPSKATRHRRAAGAGPGGQGGEALLGMPVPQ